MTALSATRPRRPSAAKKKRPSNVRALRTSLDQAEQALAAIRKGDVDVLVMGGPSGARIFTLEGADYGYRVLLEVMSEGVAKLTREGLITYCNARFAAILGAPLERTMGSSIHDLVLPNDRERLRDLLAAGGRQRSEGEFLLQAPRACRVPVLFSVVPLTINGESHCVVMTDLTEQRRHMDAIAAERAALQARLLLVDRMSAMGVVAAGVAHEINNPLAYVIGSLELMINRLPDLIGAGKPASEQVDWFHRQLERAYEGTARVRVIVRDLKAFSRADDETVNAVDLRRVLDASIALLSNEITLRARLVRDYDGLPAIRANEARLGQVFVNLLANAVQAIPAGAAERNEIRVSGYADASGHAVVEIRDTGSGIAAENLDRIFEPFFTTKAVGVGTGLGLALCHGIVSAFGGQISVESTPALGTLFRVVFSAIDGEAPSVATEPPAESRGRLLVIDDEQDFAAVLEEALAPYHEVVTTTRARRALEWIAAGERFDVILCDMKMPDMTGLDFHANLLATHPEQAARMVLMSGGFTQHEKDVPSALPSEILEKPFDLKQLRALMREKLRHGTRPHGAVTT
jgi:signal transduction histidine kinase/CheY-like chemotaxis protein